MKSIVAVAGAVLLGLTMSLWATQSSDERRGWIQIGGDDQPVKHGTFRVADGEGDHKGSGVAVLVFSPFNCSESEVTIRLKPSTDWYSNRTIAIGSDSDQITGEVESATTRPVMRCGND